MTDKPWLNLVSTVSDELNGGKNVFFNFFYMPVKLGQLKYAPVKIQAGFSFIIATNLMHFAVSHWPVQELIHQLVAKFALWSA